MTNENSVKWFREAKFGMFIHWGIYSLLEAGEWVMYSRQIPVKEYEKLTAKFNPVKFNADEWVSVAKAAGMKYIVITAKHHDGFSMFKTSVSDFNIIDATPFGRDPMKELCEACRREGIKLGFYYSHVREWRHPMAQSFETQGRPNAIGNYGNFWDYPDENKKDLQKYIDEFDMPQLKELLTQYGDIITIWFDTPSMIRPDQGEQLRDCVHSIQPACLVNSRLSNEIETDYVTMGDCEVPASGLDIAWDTPMTSSRSWGYSANDVYRPAGEFIRELSEIASKGGNYLLNIGPDSQGVMPPQACAEFRKVGKWLDINGEAIYGTSPAGLSYRPKWGCATKNGQYLYLIVFDENAKRIRLTGLKNDVTACSILGGADASFTQAHKDNSDELIIDIRNNEGGVRVVRVECKGNVSITSEHMPGDDDSIELDAISANMHIEYEYSKLCRINGATRRWYDEHDWIDWEFITTESNASYDVTLEIEAGSFWHLEDFGHEVDVFVDENRFEAILDEDKLGPRQKDRRIIKIGNLTISEPGVHEFKIVPRKIVKKNMVGLTVLGASLNRV